MGRPCRAAWDRGRSHRALASRGLSILWAQGAGQRLLDQGLDFVEMTLGRYKATIIEDVAQKSRRWIPNESTT
jgi:hypothetical protein